MPQSIADPRLPSTRSFDLIKDSLLQSHELPLAEVLHSNFWQKAFDAHEIDFGNAEEAIYTPAVTLWALMIKQHLFCKSRIDFRD